jgi:hypothetical protein
MGYGGKMGDTHGGKMGYGGKMGDTHGGNMM